MKVWGVDLEVERRGDQVVMERAEVVKVEAARAEEGDQRAAPMEAVMEGEEVARSAEKREREETEAAACWVATTAVAEKAADSVVSVAVVHIERSPPRTESRRPIHRFHRPPTHSLSAAHQCSPVPD